MVILISRVYVFISNADGAEYFLPVEIASWAEWYSIARLNYYWTETRRDILKDKYKVFVAVHARLHGAGMGNCS